MYIALLDYLFYILKALLNQDQGFEIFMQCQTMENLL